MVVAPSESAGGFGLFGSAPHLRIVLGWMGHVEVACGLRPVLVGLDRRRPDQPRAAFGVGKDAHDAGAPLELLVEALEHVGRLHVFVMGQGQPVVGRGLLDIGLDPVDQLGVFALPLGQPAGQVLAHLGQLAPVVEPPEFPQAVVVDLARYVVERVP